MLKLEKVINNTAYLIVMQSNNRTIPEVRITIVYDNTVNSELNEETKSFLKSDWGFSALVESGNTKLLFDTGANKDILLNNMRVLNIDLEEINFVFLSHAHKDHYGGLFGFLDKNSNVSVFIPTGFSEEVKNKIIKYGASLVEFRKISTLFSNIATTGSMGTDIKEQSLIVMTSKGAVILTGCSHPGIVNLVNSVKVMTDRIIGVIGGFHLLHSDKETIIGVVNKLKALGVEKIIPAHCTGELAKNTFKEVFKDNYVEAGVGLSIEF